MSLLFAPDRFALYEMWFMPNKHESCGGCPGCKEVICRFCHVQITGSNWIGDVWTVVKWEDNDKNIVNACVKCFFEYKCYVCEENYGGYQCIYFLKSLCLDCSVSNASGEYMCSGRNKECKKYRIISRFITRMIVKRRTIKKIQQKIKDIVLESEHLPERNLRLIINNYLF